MSAPYVLKVAGLSLSESYTGHLVISNRAIEKENGMFSVRWKLVTQNVVEFHAVDDYAFPVDILCCSIFHFSVNCKVNVWSLENLPY